MNIKEILIASFIGLVVLTLIGMLIYHDMMYTCLYGHYEDTYQYDVNLQMMMPVTQFVCDCEVLTDSLKVK